MSEGKGPEGVLAAFEEVTVLLAQNAMRELRLSFPMDGPPTPREEAEVAVSAITAAIRNQERQRIREALEKEVAASRQFVIYGVNVKQLQGEPLTEREIVEGLIVINRGVVTRTLDTLEDSHA